MLTTPRRGRPWGLAAAALLLWPGPGVAQIPSQPPGLIVLDERPSQEGMRVLGIYGPRQDATSPELWRVSLWQQRGSNATVRTDTLRCSTTAPMRLSQDQDRWLLRELNPGGTITPANRVDHLVWWAVCHPDQAGRDPATLAELARQLGYSGTLRETEQILPGRPR
ncbi:MAG: hypothetical protein K0U63_08030 [Cyanobacteria bacterium]|jgi:hypothetical protein|nr:hypothetical protein [Cyanobacteriota bacterium]